MDHRDQTREVYLAYHAAGHFVAHRYLLPHDLTMVVTIVSDDRCGTMSRAIIEEGRQDDVEEKAVVLYAGAAAEDCLDSSRGEEIRRTAESDEELARKLLRERSATCLEDDLRSRAATLVSRHWKEIESLASELVEWKTLDNTEAELIRQAATGWNEEAVRAALDRYRQGLRKDSTKLVRK